MIYKWVNLLKIEKVHHQLGRARQDSPKGFAQDTPLDDESVQ